MYRKPFALALLALFFVSVVQAKPADDGDHCSGSRSADPRIEELNGAIASKELPHTARADALYRRGGVWLSRREVDCAMRDFTAAIKLNPEMAEAYAARGVLWEGRGEWDRALADYDAALRINPAYPSVLLSKGIVWKKKGDLGQAMAYFDKAIDVQPQFVPALLARAETWANERNFDKAIEDYDRVIRLNPRRVDAYIDRANAWDHKGDFARAIADYDAAIKIEPRSARAYRERGIAHTGNGDYHRAASDLDEAIRLNPKQGDTFKARGRVRFYRGEFSAAAADFARAHELSADPYPAIWLYISLARSNAKINADPTPASDTWPGPVAALFMGKTTPEVVMAKAKHADPGTQRDRVCEANFYIAQWQLIRGERDAALANLRNAQAQCPSEFVERTAANVELKRLGK